MITRFFCFIFDRMGPTDVISLASAKGWLNIDYADSITDTQVTRLINTAVAWVENNTCHLLYQRPEVITVINGNYYNPANAFPPLDSAGWRFGGIRHASKGTSVYIYPFTVTSVQDGSGNDINYQSYLNALKTIFQAPYGSVITLNAGYANSDYIPSALIDACYKLITYLYENRDMYAVSYPTDIQFLINQYRRAII